MDFYFFGPWSLQEQTALERLEPSLESHLRAAQALKRKAANAVADYGRSELEVDSDVLAMEGLRSYACAYTLYMNLAAAQGTAWRRKDGEEVPRLMQLEASLRARGVGPKIKQRFRISRGVKFM